MPKQFGQRTGRSRTLARKLPVAVLIALGERNVAVRDAEWRAGGALLAMTDYEGLSVREAVEWCGSGVTVREVTRLANSRTSRRGQRPMSARRIHELDTRSSHQSGHPSDAAAAAVCAQLDGQVRGRRCARRRSRG
jgi:hypothetical protein